MKECKNPTLSAVSRLTLQEAINHKASFVINLRFLLAPRRRTGLVHTLAQSLDHLRTQAKCRFRQTQKNIFKINHACRSGIRQKTRRSGDLQTQCARHLAPPFFIENQQAGIPILPRERDRGGLAGIQGSCFFQIGQLVRNHRNPIGHLQKQKPQSLRRTRVKSFPADCFRNGHSAVEPMEQIQLPDLGEAGQHRVVTDDDHAMACRNSNERRASAKISSADWSGHTACLLSMACASQSEPSPNILLICSNESTSLEYASAAKASRAARPRFWNPAPSSAARSSGMSTVKVTGRKVGHPSSSSKFKNIMRHSARAFLLPALRPSAVRLPTLPFLSQ